MPVLVTLAFSSPFATGNSVPPPGVYGSMFETASVSTKHNPWSVAASFSAQAACVAAVLLYSIWHFETLGPARLETPLPPLPSLPREAVKIVASRASAARSIVAAVKPRVFVAPSRIPAATPQIIDNTGEIPQFTAAQTTTGEGFAGVPGGIVGTLPNNIGGPPPAAKPTATSPKEPAAPIRIGGVVLAAKLIHKVVPVYPPLARSARVSGTVALQGIIARDGSIKDLRVLSGHPLLVAAAVEAVRQWRYSPTVLNGQAVEVTAPITVTFTLGQ